MPIVRTFTRKICRLRISWVRRRIPPAAAEERPCHVFYLCSHPRNAQRTKGGLLGCSLGAIDSQGDWGVRHARASSGPTREPHSTTIPG